MQSFNHFHCQPSGMPVCQPNSHATIFWGLRIMGMCTMPGVVLYFIWFDFWSKAGALFFHASHSTNVRGTGLKGTGWSWSPVGPRRMCCSCSSLCPGLWFMNHLNLWFFFLAPLILTVPCEGFYYSHFDECKIGLRYKHPVRVTKLSQRQNEDTHSMFSSWQAGAFQGGNNYHLSSGPGNSWSWGRVSPIASLMTYASSGLQICTLLAVPWPVSHSTSPHSQGLVW